MSRLNRLVGAGLIIVCSISSQAQQTDSVLSKTDSSKFTLQHDKVKSEKKPFLRSLIAPGFMIGYGFATIKTDPLQDMDEDLQKTIWVNNPHSQCHIDNYLQFAPAVAVYGLNIIGIHGKNNFIDRSFIYFIANVFMSVTVTSIKSLTHELRPDRSDYLSFPSGHTAEAFLSAEFLRQEYKDVSPWYGVAGYLTATATGLLRMYNNKHWLNDVIAGAGFGIASTRLAYWIYPAISKNILHHKPAYTMILPYYQNHMTGLSMLYTFHKHSG